jgi:hypothetical protein
MPAVGLCLLRVQSAVLPARDGDARREVIDGVVIAELFIFNVSVPEVCVALLSDCDTCACACMHAGEWWRRRKGARCQ